MHHSRVAKVKERQDRERMQRMRCTIGESFVCKITAAVDWEKL